MCTGFRLVWIMCWGIPIHAWDMESIKKIAKSVDVVKIDEEVEDLQRLDRARVLVKTP